MALRLNIRELRRKDSGSSEAFHFEGDGATPQSLADLGLDGTLTVDGLVTFLGDRYLAKGTVRGRRQTVCDRCLRPVVRDLDCTFEQLFREQPDDDDSRLCDGQTLDLDDTVDETVRLAAPSQTLCREDCRGLCPQCGKDLNEGPCDCAPSFVDPRLDKLRQWRSKPTP